MQLPTSSSTNFREFSFPSYPDSLWGVLSLLYNEHQGFSLRLNMPEPEANYSPRSTETKSVEYENPEYHS
jgi:hypothetical protein